MPLVLKLEGAHKYVEKNFPMSAIERMVSHLKQLERNQLTERDCDGL